MEIAASGLRDSIGAREKPATEPLTSFEDRSCSEVLWDGAELLGDGVELFWEDADGVWEGAVDSSVVPVPLSFLTWASKIFTAVSRDAFLPVEGSSVGGYVWTVTLTSPTLPVIR